MAGPEHVQQKEKFAGLLLIAAAALALVAANSRFAGAYQALLHFRVGMLSVEHWVADGLMAVFFLLVGLEVKREWFEGRLALARAKAAAVGGCGVRHGGAGIGLSARHGFRSGVGQRLGDPGRDGHRLRDRRPGASRPTRPAVDQGAARHHRHRRRHRRRADHRFVLRRRAEPDGRRRGSALCWWPWLE